MQVFVSPAENKDGSGGPADVDELKDLVFPREPVELERKLPEPTERQSIVVVRRTNRRVKSDQRSAASSRAGRHVAPSLCARKGSSGFRNLSVFP